MGMCVRHAAASPYDRQHQRLPEAPRGPAKPVDVRPVASPIGGSTAALPSAASLMILVQAEAALQALGGTRKDDMLRILQELDAAKVDGATLKLSPMYDKIGSLAQGIDAVATAAKALRRKWRVIMDDASRAGAS